MKFNLNKSLEKQQQRYKEFNVFTYVKNLLHRLLLISITTFCLLLVTIMVVGLCNRIVNVGLILLTSVMLICYIAYIIRVIRKKKKYNTVNDINAE